MSKILQLPKEYELWLTYSWSNDNHGICGHTFEVIDYYHILKNHFKVGILLAEDIDMNMFVQAIQEKYDFNTDELKDIKRNTLFKKRPRLVSGSNIIFTDGGVLSTKDSTLLFDNIFHMACGDKEVKDNIKENVWILQDDRVYDPVTLNGINYKKKILFSRLKRLKRPALFPGWLRTIMLYSTKNCRNIPEAQIKKISNKYKGYHIMVLTNSENKGKDSEWIKYYEVPTKDLFNRFIMYYYTPIERKHDCSPRFIAECRHYNKQVVYDSKINDEYLQTDLGLKYRMQDIEEDFESLYLEENDDIINIIKNIIYNEPNKL